MLTDLRYALEQLRPVAANDRVQRAIDAIERCIEAENKRLDDFNEFMKVDESTDAEIEELFGAADVDEEYTAREHEIMARFDAIANNELECNRE